MDDTTSLPKLVDSRNQLNDLNGKEWLVETKSFFYQKGLGANDPNAKIEKQHPAPFSFQDVMRLILFFTKKGMSVLDPFGGVGSTAKACALTGRICTSIELSEKWHNLAIQRLETEVGKDISKEHIFICGDSCLELQNLKKESFDFISIFRNTPMFTLWDIRILFNKFVSYEKLVLLCYNIIRTR